MDERVFRNAMGKFATGVTVITTEQNGEIHGMTANAFMSVSLNPKLILISIDQRAKMLNKINEAGTFAVNILAEDQKELSMQFAGQLKEKKEAEFDYMSGIPVIKGALANIVCKIYRKHAAGDHTIFLGEVVDIELREGAPLGFYEGKYSKIVS
ncbi:flavin reductase family protein [Bacillus safensis]|uniref:flavin reductase family protein n=1 Tax=Bacillus safensis TaxID=561879 RepID=UPI000B435EBA|nr:flavin reductase family protein [Bacillus safensis]MCY7493674.1 flavin reductase family protein [Bacillus safensis]MED4993117.1 flavin reductase family protein [Bacillus safensis]UDB46008.1 flavin reductase family protein [Bacillus safensis]